jgi:DNA polymerase-3 subunit epsilon
MGGHRIVEIGCVEVIDGKVTGSEYRTLLNPEREVDKDAEAVHGYNLKKLKNEPKFPEIANDFLNFIEDGILVIHNAGFDITFLNNELALSQMARMDNEIIDTLILARKNYTGERASLNALCDKFNVDKTSRTLHGALLDAQLLSHVFCVMATEMEIHLPKPKYIKKNKPKRADYSTLEFVCLA